METASDRERWAKIANALATPVVKTQAAMWELERKQMLEVVSRFWDVESANFRNFVSNPQNSESMGAIVLTSLEDMPEVRFTFSEIVSCRFLRSKDLT